MNFFHELKRRNVFRVAIMYLVAAWLIIQIASTLAPALLLPEWTTRLVTLLLMIGFPVALIFAWAFELTPEGMKRTKEVDIDESITHHTGKKLEYGIIGILAIAVAFLLLRPSEVTESPILTANATPSIAVLPFEDFSPDKDQEYFSKGIAEEILNLLAKTNNMKVAARTSSFAFYGSEEDIRNIGQKLDVSTVLEGSIRKAGGTLRITAQLINVNDGYHIWSETYDRDMSDIFAVQDEIAASILTSLKVHLLGEEAQATATLKADVDAYNHYLIGKERMAGQTMADFIAANAKFEEAIAIDPDFASARVHQVLAMLEIERLSEWDKKTEASKKTDSIANMHLKRSLELAPNLPQVHAIKALYDLRRYNYDDAKVYFDRALQLNPNYAQAYLWRADLHFSLNNFKAMLADREKAYALDPMSLEISRELAFDYRSFGRQEDANRIIDRMFELRPHDQSAYRAYITNFSAHAQFVEAIKATKEGLKHHPDDPWLKDMEAWMLFYIGDYEAALTKGYDYIELDYGHLMGWPEEAVSKLQDILKGPHRESYFYAAIDYYRFKGDKDQLSAILKESIAHADKLNYPWKTNCSFKFIEAIQYTGIDADISQAIEECRNRTDNQVKYGYLCPCSLYTLVAFAIIDGRPDDAVSRAYEWLAQGDYMPGMENSAILSHLKSHDEYEELLHLNQRNFERQNTLYWATVANKSPSDGG